MKERKASGSADGRCCFGAEFIGRKNWNGGTTGCRRADEKTSG